MNDMITAEPVFAERDENQLRRFWWRLCLGLVLSGVVAAWLHSALTYYIAPPFDNPIDVLFLLIVWCAKLCAVLAIPGLVIRRMAFHIHGNRTRALVAFAAFTLPALLFTYGCHPLRDFLSRMVDSDTQRYYPVAAGADLSAYPGGAWFKAAWNRGGIFFFEFLAVTATAGLVIGCGFFLGKRPWLAMLLATPWAWLTFKWIATATPICKMDYDFFFGSTALGPATIDLLILVVPADGVTVFGLSFALLILIAGIALDRRWSSELEARSGLQGPSQ